MANNASKPWFDESIHGSNVKNSYKIILNLTKLFIQVSFELKVDKMASLRVAIILVVLGVALLAISCEGARRKEADLGDSPRGRSKIPLDEDSLPMAHHKRGIWDWLNRGEPPTTPRPCLCR